MGVCFLGKIDRSKFEGSMTNPCPQNDDGFVIDPSNLLLSIFPRKQTPLKILEGVSFLVKKDPRQFEQSTDNPLFLGNGKGDYLSENDGFVIDRSNLLLSFFPRKQTPLKIEF